MCWQQQNNGGVIASGEIEMRKEEINVVVCFFWEQSAVTWAGAQ